MNNKKLLACTVPVLLLSGGVQAAAEVKVSGHLNRAILAIDDGEGTETYFVDNKNSSSRFRIVATGDITDTIQAGAMFEMEFESNPSSEISRMNPSVDAELEERHAQVFFKGPFGDVYLGQGNGAANGRTHVDLSGTNVVSLLGHAHLMGGRFTFFDDGVAGPTMWDAMANFDFESRYDRVAYETNQFGPLKLAASVGRKDDMVYEASALYTAQVGFGKIAAGFGYSSEQVEGADSNDTLGGSASVLLTNGLNAAISYSRLEADADYQSTNTTLRLGYRTGKHAASLDYGITEDRDLEGDEATYTSLNYVYKPIGWVELFASVRHFELDRSGADYDDIGMLITGSRIKF